MEITTDMIKELRAATGAGILDCRKALTEANGDFQKAVDWLREKGMATAAKRADREASQSIVELYSHGGGRVGVRGEVNCETDCVARSEKFRELAHEILAGDGAEAMEAGEGAGELAAMIGLLLLEVGGIEEDAVAVGDAGGSGGGRHGGQMTDD